MENDAGDQLATSKSYAISLLLGVFLAGVLAVLSGATLQLLGPVLPVALNLMASTFVIPGSGAAAVLLVFARHPRSSRILLAVYFLILMGLLFFGALVFTERTRGIEF